MRYLPLLLIAFPAYGAPVCTDATYSTISLRVLTEEWKDVLADKEKLCIIARLQWAHKENGMEAATILTPVQENFILYGWVDYRNCQRQHGGRR